MSYVGEAYLTSSIGFSDDQLREAVIVVGVNVSGSISGSLPINIGDPGDLALDVTVGGLQVTQGSTTFGQKGFLAQGAVANIAPTYVHGQTSPVSLTASGSLRSDLAQVGGFNIALQAAGEQLIAIEGRAANGAAVVGNPVLMGGQDGASARSLLTDISGRQQVVGAAADGAATVGNPILIAGQDGTNVQSLFTDTSGRARVVGAAADGVAVTGDPVLIAGQDGTNTQSILTDTSGRQNVVGAAADGAAVTGNPVLIGGQDGTNAQSLLTDTSGRPNVVGASTQGAAVAGNPVLICGEDAGGLTQRLQTTILPPVDSEPGLVVRQVVSQTGTLANVPASAVSVTLLAANTARIGAIIYNDSVQSLFIKFGITASATSFTVLLGVNEYYEVPYGYTGRIDGIWNVAVGNARVTVLT